MRSRLFILVALLGAVFVASHAVPNHETVKGTELFVTNEGRTECLCVQTASDETSRALGLSPDGDPAPFGAMVFEWPVLNSPSFWMKNTAGHLQVAFADDQGTVRQTADLQTCDGDSCPIVTSTVATRFAVEAPVLAHLGIVVGTSLRLGEDCEVRK